MFRFYLNDSEEQPNSIVFRDFVMGALGLFVVLFLIIIIHVNPSKKDDVTIIPPGNTSVYVFWDDEINVDIDTWVWVASEPKPIGYSNKNGFSIDLLKDDLGFTGDNSEKNFEVIIARGILTGKWIINLHYYSIGDGRMVGSPAVKIKVIVETIITGKNGEKDKKQQILTRDVTLVSKGQEITVASFIMTQDGGALIGSLDFESQYSLRGKREFSQ